MLELTSKTTPQEAADILFHRYLSISQYYQARNAVLLDLGAFFDGVQWETTNTQDVEKEIVRTTWNYARMAVFRHVALMINTQPRVNVHGNTMDIAARHRETFLRSVFSFESLWGVWAQRVELNASKLSYGVMKVEWDKKVRKEKVGVPTSEGAGPSVARSFNYLRESPISVRSIPPANFYPVYADSDYNDPNDFLFVFRVIPDQMVDALEEKYGVKLQATNLPIAGTTGSCEVVEWWSKDHYMIFAVTREDTKDTKGQSQEPKWTVYPLVKYSTHKYGRVPFFILQNIVNPNQNPTLGGSISDVELIMEANKHLNTMNTIIASTIMTHADPPTVYTSSSGHLSLEKIRLGAGEIIPLLEDEALVPVEWEGQPEIVRLHMMDTVKAMEDLGNLSHASLAGDQPASGIGQRLSYANTELTLALKTNPRIATLQAIGSYCLRLCDMFLKDDEVISFSQLDRLKSTHAPAYMEVDLRKSEIQGAYACSVVYGDIMPRDRMKDEQHIAYLRSQDMISHRTALEHVSYVTDPIAEMQYIRDETKDPELNPERYVIYKNAKMMDQQGGKPRANAQGPGITRPDAQRRAAGIKFDAAPPVPATPEMPTATNAPQLARGVNVNAGQMFPGRPGQFQGPPIEGSL